MIIEKFWMVYNLTKGGRPTVRHARFDLAVAELDRLGQLQPGDVFVVLSPETGACFEQQITRNAAVITITP